ncbi:MAG: glycosyltransferase family 4 protein [Fusobacterium varium]|uniref:glycosyltransferase family 4 protein n=1 Tax=Fusobacterium varium TaxID=856 RepID=UPI00242D65AE|nr:glycosyltransferase [Fusobacterium varium]UYI78229.1 MAG: glycosyltransferase family 4 protein [Fusobacterium varium]
MIKKMLFISSTDINETNFGGSICSYRNYKIMENFFLIDLINFSKLDSKNQFRAPKNKFFTLMNNIFNYAGLLTYSSEKMILALIKKKKYEIIFLESSNFGKLAKKIKKINNNIKIITFFQNIEYDFIKSRIKREGKIYYILLKATYYNEKLAVRFSDYLITLNSRDSGRLLKKYRRNTDCELPITLNDKIIKNNFKTENSYILFVGSLFFANYYGIKWFVDNVMSSVDKILLIVGKKFETKREELERKNVKVIGTVDNLEEYYINADCVVMPIFDGAGMKVKTAEALMYGKTIYGTKEAFEGYNIEYEKIGGICNSKDEFINKINRDKGIKYNEYSREIFKKNYSYDSAIKIMKKFLKKNKLI